MRKRVLSVLLAELMLLAIAVPVMAVAPPEVEEVVVTAVQVEPRGAAETINITGTASHVRRIIRARVGTARVLTTLVVRLSCGASQGATNAHTTAWANARTPGAQITVTGSVHATGGAALPGYIRIEM